jgi:heptosyltransferase-2
MTKRILIIGPSWVGDTVMAQSLFKLLRQQKPQATLEVLAPAWTFSLLSRMPEIAHAIEMPLTHGELKLRERYRLAKSLRERHYDQAIVLPNSFKSALIPWWANIAHRTGWVGECRYVLLNDIRRLDKKRYPLMIEQYLALGLPTNAPLIKPYPYPAFSISAESQQATLAKHHVTLSGRPILALSPGAEFGPAKRWPEEYYAAVANEKIAQGWDVWLFGSPKDQLVSAKVMELTQHRCLNHTGRLLLAETIDLLSLVTGLVTNDSGLMHVAAALQKPLIAIYGSTSPAFTPPLSPESQVLQLSLDCQPCFARTCPLQHHRCMRDLSPTQVLASMSSWGMA